MKKIPYGKQQITREDIDAVIETLQSDFLTQGPKVKEFEDAFASYIGCKYAVAVANGTAALHLAALALGVHKGDKVITTPITFAASANCVEYCGGEVVFADIDDQSFLIDIEKVRALLEASPRGTYKGIIPVDFAGKAVDLEVLRQLADEYGLWILEDACHAPGGYFVDQSSTKQHCGNSKFADAAIFSFHPVKHIACGEGGMITTDDESLYKKLMALRTHGITRDSKMFTNDITFANGAAGVDSYPGWYMEMQQLGFNYRLTDFQAALGVSQLKRADAGLARRKAIAKRYNQAFKKCTFLKTQDHLTDPGHAYHLYVVEAERRLELYNYLVTQNIFAQIHYIPVHLMPFYRNRGWTEGDCPNAEAYYKKCISLPMYPTLSDQDQDTVIAAVLKFYQQVS